MTPKTQLSWRDNLKTFWPLLLAASGVVVSFIGVQKDLQHHVEKGAHAGADDRISDNLEQIARLRETLARHDERLKVIERQ